MPTPPDPPDPPEPPEPPEPCIFPPTPVSLDPPGSSLRDGKYARVERERRFLLAAPPPEAAVTGRRRISDRYLAGTRLRLRRVEHDDGTVQLKLTQKIPAAASGPVQGLITNTYLSPAEYAVLADLPARLLTKTRLTVPPVVIDVFDPPLDGLILAEAEFPDEEAALAFTPPASSVAEVTADPRFTGGRLSGAPRADLLAWLADFGLGPAASPTT